MEQKKNPMPLYIGEKNKNWLLDKKEVSLAM